MGRIQTMHTRPILLVLLVAVLQVEASRRRPFSDAGRRSAWGGNWGGTRRRAPAPYSDTRRRAPYSDTRRRAPYSDTRRRAPAPYSDTRRRAPYSDTRRRAPYSDTRRR